MPFGMVGGVGRYIRILDGVVMGEGKGQFWGHSKSLQLLLLDRPYTSITSCYWPVVTTSLSGTVSDTLSFLQSLQLPVTSRSPSPLTIMFKSQATCTFQFMCKHTELKHAIFPKL